MRLETENGYKEAIIQNWELVGWRVYKSYDVYHGHRLFGLGSFCGYDWKV